MTRPSSDESTVMGVRRLLQAMIAQPRSVATLAPRELGLTLRLARRVRLVGWLAAQLDQAGELDSLPKVAVEQLSDVLVVAESRARMANWELNRMAHAFGDAESPGQVLVLKGCAYLLLDTPNAAGRLFADVDLLVAERDLEPVEAALTRHGWQAAQLTPYDQNFYRAWSQELPAMVHVEREVEIDVHHNLRGRYAPFKPEPSLLLGDAQAIAGSRFQALSDPDIVLHSMTHLFFGGDLADDLRDLVDIDALLRHFSARDDGFWERLVARAEQLELGLPAFYSLRYTLRLLDTPVPDRVITALSACAPSGLTVWLMDRLVPLALFPQHPDAPSKRVSFARWLLYVRSHWVSMPPLMLLRHLTYKFYVRHLQGRLGF